MLAKILENPEFLNKILWTDESTFKRDEYLNLHNYHEWRVENPHLMREDRSQYQFKKIDAASEEINARNFARLVKRSFVRRCRACIRAAGKQFEHLL
ncbi:unnamed protein product [Euphydryas editha]|uniref:Transposase n=1 Tax=Euphydryas editha TaxID=104508 RepID=A0AAU9U2U5_EUPED|nr:unnamed protein product [Euphydryas editha]